MLYISLRQYEYLVAVARTGSLTAAARELNVSQPSLSVAISRIEERLGQKLFTRGKGVPFRATRHGRTVVARAASLLDQAARLEGVIGADAPSRSGARIAFFDDLAPHWLGSTLSALGAGVPELGFTASTGSFTEIARQLKEGRIELALTYDLGLDASHERAVVARASPHAFIGAGDALGDRARVSLKQLAARPLVLFDDGLSIQHMLKLFAVRGLKPRVAHRVDSLEVMRSLAAHGAGVGISYTNPPGATSYDGTALRSVRIADRAAVEPIVLTWLADEAEPLPFSRIVAAARRAG